MAPQRIPRGAPEDSRSEDSSRAGIASGPTITKSRRAPNSAVTAGSTLKDVTAAPTMSASANNGQTGGQDVAGGIHWSSLDNTVLHAYRHAYRLNTPAAFASPFNQAILTKPGIGQYSPTMARRKDRRRVHKDNLALAVRKDFNAAVAHEQEVVTAFLYTIRNQDKNFRMRFPPSRPK